MRHFAPLIAILFFLTLVSCSHVRIVPLSSQALTVDESMKLGAIYESKGETELALREYGNAAAKGSAAAHFAIANIHIKNRRYNDAESSLLKAVAIDPSNGAYHNNLGWVYMETGRLEKAEEAAKEAIKADPARIYAYLDTLGVIQIKRGRLTEAQKSLSDAAALAPSGEKNGLLEIYGHLLELYNRTGDTEKAREVEARIKGLKEPGQ